MPPNILHLLATACSRGGFKDDTQSELGTMALVLLLRGRKSAVHKRTSMGASAPPFLSSLPVVGLHPEGLQALWLPSLETKERARRQQQRHQWFIGQGIIHKGSWSDTPLCAGRTWQQS